MIKNLESNGQTIDYLIARSGFIGRQILRLARFLHQGYGGQSDQVTGLSGFWRRHKRLHKIKGIRLVSFLVIIFYTYYIGGSLTRSDQLTFARLHGMSGGAYKLTLFNAIFCGIPCAFGYFLLGEGFEFLMNIHSYAELPSLFAQHTSLGIGIISLTVDVCRAIDSAWRRRCWAPFGIMPFVINFPTYLKRMFQRNELAHETRAREIFNSRQR